MVKWTAHAKAQRVGRASPSSMRNGCSRFIPRNATRSSSIGRQQGQRLVSQSHSKEIRPSHHAVSPVTHRFIYLRVWHGEAVGQARAGFHPATADRADQPLAPGQAEVHHRDARGVD